MPFLEDLRQIMDAFKVPFASPKYQNVYEDVIALLSLVLSRRSLRDSSTTLAPKRGVALVETVERLR